MMITTVFGILALILIIICIISAVIYSTDYMTNFWRCIAEATFMAFIVCLVLIWRVYSTKTTLTVTEYDVQTIAADYGLEPKVHTTHYDDADIRAIWGSKDYIEIEHFFGIKTMKYVVYKNEPRVDDFADYKRDSISSEVTDGQANN